MNLFSFTAFKFCLQYTRKAEFRKLCDNLRMHLGQIQRHHNQSTAINLNNPESQSMHLETRLVQLDSAISMELWQVRPHTTGMKALTLTTLWGAIAIEKYSSYERLIDGIFFRKLSRQSRISTDCLHSPKSPPSHN